MYGAIDPIYMVMLIRLLGQEYVVWDKEATIQFKRPGRSALYARFRVDEEETQAIKAELVRQESTQRNYQIELVDEKGVVHAIVTKTIYIRRRD